MRCPNCKSNSNKVIDSRVVKDGGAIRRRRECQDCAHRFTTYEYIEKSELLVQKNGGALEEYDRGKLKKGIVIACGKRPVSHDRIEKIVDSIYNELTEKNQSTVKSTLIGELVMKKLKETDEIAYVRFASVYRKFKDVKEFMKELTRIID